MVIPCFVVRWLANEHLVDEYSQSIPVHGLIVPSANDNLSDRQMIRKARENMKTSG
jgi:hypothetical protein